jgi:Type I restriction modification DNA specificity domain
MRNISQEAFKDIMIPLPHLAEQHEIVRRIEFPIQTRRHNPKPKISNSK